MSESKIMDGDHCQRMLPWPLPSECCTGQEQLTKLQFHGLTLYLADGNPSLNLDRGSVKMNG